MQCVPLYVFVRYWPAGRLRGVRGHQWTWKGGQLETDQDSDAVSPGCHRIFEDWKGTLDDNRASQEVVGCHIKGM